MKITDINDYKNDKTKEVLEKAINLPLDTEPTKMTPPHIFTFGPRKEK